jgi:hypothetical protein
MKLHHSAYTGQYSPSSHMKLHHSAYTGQYSPSSHMKLHHSAYTGQYSYTVLRARLFSIFLAPTVKSREHKFPSGNFHFLRACYTSRTSPIPMQFTFLKLSSQNRGTLAPWTDNRISICETIHWIQLGPVSNIWVSKVLEKINKTKTIIVSFQVFHSYISMQGVNGFIPPSARHPVTPTTPKERGEVPIPFPVHWSRGGGSVGRQLYTKRTDHGFCCILRHTHRLPFDSRV